MKDRFLTTRTHAHSSSVPDYYDRERIILALLTAALAPAMAAGLVTIGDRNEDALAFAFGAFFVALAHAVILYLPAYFGLRKLHLVTWWTSIICGFTVGALPLTILSILLFWRDTTEKGWGPIVSAIGIFGLCGALGGFAAWLVWRFLPPPKTFES